MWAGVQLLSLDMRPFRDDPLGKLQQFLGLRWCSAGRLRELNFEFLKISDDLLSHVPPSLASLNLNGCQEVSLRTPVNNIEYFPPNFEGLVLGCIDADFCK